MNGERLFTITAALCCLIALGSAAETLDGAMETSPDDAIDVDQDVLPIGEGDFRELTEQTTSSSGGESEGSSSESEESSSEESDESSSEESEESSSEGGKESSSGGESEGSSSGGGSGQEGQHEPEWNMTLWEQLLLWLRRIFEWLLKLLPYAVVLTGVALALRRLNLLDRLAAVVETDDGTDESATEVGPPQPENEVARLWLEMMDQFGLTDEPTKTPGECAREAIDAGANPAPVKRVTEAFEEVRYGETGASEALQRRARDGFEQFRDSRGEGK